MTKVSMRVDYTLPSFSLTEQIRLAAEAGVDAIEYGEMNGYDCALAAETAAKYGLHFSSIGFYNTVSARVGMPFAELKEDLQKTIECAEILGCKVLMALSNDNDIRDEAAKRQFIENALPAAELCAKHDMLLLLESHNTKDINPVADMTRYYLDKTDLVYDIMDRMNCPNVKLLFDVYHCQMMEGDLTNNIRNHIDRIAHFHFAGLPNRDEPFLGEVNTRYLVQQIRALGYQGYFGLEYRPTNEMDLDTLAAVVRYIKES